MKRGGRHGGTVDNSPEPAAYWGCPTWGWTGDNLARRCICPAAVLARPQASHAFSTGSSGGSGSSADDPREVLDLPEGGVASAHLLFDLLDAVQDRGVVAAAEDLADLHQ